MSIATQIERLQGVRDQIRTKMVSLGLSENTDLLQNLADDLDGVSKITPTSSTTDPGTSYTNTTLDRSTSTRYVKIPKGYNGANTKFTVSGVPNGAYSASVSSHTVKTKPTASSSISGSITDIASTVKPTGNYYMITPSLSTTTGSVEAAGKATISTAGYIAAGGKTERSTIDVSVSATQGKDYYLRTGEYSISVPSHTTTNATASSSVSGTITGITTTTVPASGTDGTDYYTITPKLTTGAGSSKVKAKATIDTAGYIATGSQETSEASKSVGVTATQGDNYYLPAGSYSASVASHTASNATASSSVTGSITNIVTSTKPSTGTDGTDYYTITPKLTTTKGSSKAKGKATISTAGYLATGNTTSSESSVDVGVTATQGDSYYLKASSVTKEDPGTSYANKATVTPSTSTQYVKVTAGYLPNSKITVEAIPSPYYSTSGVTATAGTVLKDYKFVNSSGATVTGTIATATSSNVSGSVSGSDPSKITLTTAATSGSSSTTATASATVAKGLYTGSSNIEKSLTSKTFTATAEATLATSVTGSTTVPSTLPAGTVTITPNTDNTKRIYSDSTNKGFVTNIVLNAMDASSVSSATTTDPGTDYTNKATVTPSTSAQYIKITKGYLPNSKITVSKMADGSISSATTTNPGDSYANRVTVTPSGTDAQYIKISKGYLPDGKITINKMAAGSVASATTTNPGDSYANQTTVTPSGTDAQYVKISAGYLPNSKITINKMASGSVSSASTTDPGTDYTNKTTVTPSLDKQYVKLAAGYLPNSKITVNAIPNQKTSDDVTASVTAGISDITSINASQVTNGVTVTASASGSTVVPVGYYSTQVSKTPSDSKSTTIKPKLAGTSGSIELTAGTSAFTKTSTADYSNGFITSVKVNPTPSETKEFTPTIAGGTVSPAPGKLLSSVIVRGVPTLRLTLSSGGWGNSDSNVTAGKYYYDIFAPSITASNNLYVMPDNASAAQSFGVYAYSQSRLSEDNMGTLQFRAMERPTSDLTYTVYRLD